MQLEKLTRLLRDHNQSANHDYAVEDLTVRRLRISETVAIADSSHRDDREVDRLNVVGAQLAALYVILRLNDLVGIHDVTVNAKSAQLYLGIERILIYIVARDIIAQFAFLHKQCLLIID